MSWCPAREADFRALPDEALTFLAQHHCQMGLEVLMDLYRKWIEAFVGRWWIHRLKRHDLPGALQAAWMAFVPAVEGYDLSQLERKDPCHFRTYLEIKVRSRLNNFLRDNRRQKAHCLTTAHLEKEADRQVEKCYVAEKYDIWSASKLGDPALLALRYESELRIAQAIGRLDSRYAQVWQGYCDGWTKQQVADEIGVSVSTVKRMVVVLKNTVRAVVQEDNP